MKRTNKWVIVSIAAMIAAGCSGLSEDDGGLLMPDYDANREARIRDIEGRFAVPKGFVVEEVASNELVGSVVNMTFDHKGRPALSIERSGIRLLEDRDDDGVYETILNFTDKVNTAHGMHYIGAGDLLVNANGSDGTGIYRVRDTDGDDQADEVTLILKSRGGIQEHGPHAILTGPDASLYVMYGNHAYPDTEIDPLSPSRALQEDNLLPRYVDPRGHANSIAAPGGTIHRFTLDGEHCEQVVGGFRNSFDFAMNSAGEMFTFESDMEWDVGLPWFRPVRAIHCAPSGDFGWRTGSSKIPFYAVDTLPGVDDVGRGSPVGVCFYYHHAYPERYYGAYFMGDWSRGRIRVMFPDRNGATYAANIVDFLLGEPLNVTDMDVGPDGNLYFALGGRMTHGGLYRVRYKNPSKPPKAEGIEAVIKQPMPRSAWGKEALRAAKSEIGLGWGASLRDVALDESRNTEDRLRAVEALQVLGPKPDFEMLTTLAGSHNPDVRAQAIFLFGTYQLHESAPVLVAALNDPDAFVVRRACDSLIRSGLKPDWSADGGTQIEDGLVNVLLKWDDRFVRNAARIALVRSNVDAWRELIVRRGVPANPRWMTDLVLSLIYAQDGGSNSEIIFAKLEELSRAQLTDDELLDYLRVVQLAYIRKPGADTKAFEASAGPRLLDMFPAADWRVNRELQVVLAHMETPGTVEAILAELTPDKSREEQIHSAYVLRTVQTGWNHELRNRFVAWFDGAWDFRGAASMEGYIRNLWDSAMELLPKDERHVAERRKERIFDEKAAETRAILAAAEGEDVRRSDLAQMSFEELSEYLEFDPMNYREPNLERGQKTFIRAKCASCHVFGSIGNGGGPDLSTVVKRFRRRDILESIMYPSRVISDQYSGVELELESWESVSGMVVGETDERITLITATGERLDVPKTEIVARRDAKASIMPEGLLETMNLGDLVALIQFLEHGSDV